MARVIVPLAITLSAATAVAAASGIHFRTQAASGPGSTAFVGDGVNDMLAIVRADVGVAATDASPATIALADVVIASAGRLRVPLQR
ncbi:MAG: hypothetical protein ACTHWH_03255 [Marinobacter sp.]